MGSPESRRAGKACTRLRRRKIVNLRKIGAAGLRRGGREEREDIPSPAVYGRLLNVRSMASTLSITDTLIVPQIAGSSRKIWPWLLKKPAGQ